MMDSKTTTAAVLIVIALLAAVAACQNQEGPVERTGKAVDKAVENAADSMRNVPPKEEGPIERAGKAVDKAVDKTGEQVENAGTAIQETAKGDRK